MRTAVAVGLLCLASACPPAPEPPTVQTAGLDPSAAGLIQHQLDKVKVARRSGKVWGELGAVLKSFGFREQAGYCLMQAERLDRKEPRWPYLQATLRISDSPSEAMAKLRRAVALRSEERRVGKECRSRWSPYD